MTASLSRIISVRNWGSLRWDRIKTPCTWATDIVLPSRRLEICMSCHGVFSAHSPMARLIGAAHLHKLFRQWIALFRHRNFICSILALMLLLAPEHDNLVLDRLKTAPMVHIIMIMVTRTWSMCEKHLRLAGRSTHWIVIHGDSVLLYTVTVDSLAVILNYLKGAAMRDHATRVIIQLVCGFAKCWTNFFLRKWAMIVVKFR